VRETWPRGLRLILWSEVLSLAVGTGQILSAVSKAHGQFPFHGFEAAYVVVALALSLAAVVAGFLARRQLFANLALIESVLNALAGIWFNYDFAQDALQDLIDGQFSIASYFNVNAWYGVWNSAILALNLVIAYYLCRYELFRSRSAPPA